MTSSPSLHAEIGKGIFTIPDVSRILNIPSRKVRSALKLFWNKRFAEGDSSYSWGNKNQAVNFHTMIEFYVFFKLKELGVHYSKIITAHNKLSEFLETPYPFAHSKLLTDGKKIFMESEEFMITADGKNQTVIADFISLFCDKIVFNDSNLPEKYYPAGKNEQVVVDPKHQFGLPTIEGTNIRVETLNNLYLSGESINKIAKLYDINDSDVQSAVDFCKVA